jgi:ATP-binding cassette, subfamily B, bacterial PglK
MLLLTAKKIWYLLNKKEQWQAIVLLLMMLVGAIIEIISMGMLPVYISLIAQQNTAKANPIVGYLTQIIRIDSPREAILVMGVILVGIFLIKSIYLISLSYAQGKFVFRKMRSVEVKLYRIYMRSSYSFHLGRNSSELIDYINRETYFAFNGAIVPFMIFLTEGILMLMVGIMLFIFEPLGSLAAILTLGIISISYYQLVKKKIGSIGELEQLHAMKMLQWTSQGLSGVKEIKVAGKEEFFIHNFNWHAKEFTTAIRASFTIENIPRLALETIALIVIVGLVTIGLIQGRSGTSLLSGITLFAVAAFRLLPSVNRILNALTSIRLRSGVLDIIYQDIRYLTERIKLEGEYESEDTINSVKIPLNKNLEFKNVSYKYPQSEQLAIEDLSIIVPKGQIVGIVGHSGAGKTTFVDLLLGLLNPTSGQILADGVDIKTNLKAWRRNIGYIPQNIYLFDDTIRANIAFGYFSHQIDDNRIWKVLKAVQLQDFVAQLSAGLDTFVGESGVRLSGGQRQRIGIARALYRNPRLLIMDEATSALDNQTEKAVTDAIERLSKNRTVIIIAHRLTTIQKCDVIYMMSSGKIICQGTYNRLLADSPEFQKLSMVTKTSEQHT